MIRILIADDHQLMREGLSKIIEEDAPDIVIAGCAADGNETIAVLESVEIHVLLLDLSMPGPCGMPLIARIRERTPQVAILVLTMYDDEQYAARAMRVGAMGFLTKVSICPAGLISAIRNVAAGQPVIDSSVAVTLIQQPANRSHAQLSMRERTVFDLLVAGKTVTNIADMLGLSVKTISTFKTRICHKLNIKGVADLVQYAVERKLIDPSPSFGVKPPMGLHPVVTRTDDIPAPVHPSVERRTCKLTESKVNVAIILRDMLGRNDASIYLKSAKVPRQVSNRVLTNSSFFLNQEDSMPSHASSTSARHCFPFNAARPHD